MYKHLFKKRLPKKLYKQWNLAINQFVSSYPDLKIKRLLIDLKGIHGFPIICGKYLYKIEILNESQNIFKRKKRIELLCQQKLLHICYPIEIISDKNSVCYKYEYFRNGDLLEYLHSHHLTYLEIDNILTQCLKILHRIHRESFLYYDIKPENIFVKNNKSVIFGDIETMRHTSENINGTNLGTNTYHPPKNINILYNHIDIFAFGKTIYKVLCIQCISDLKKYGLNDDKMEQWFDTPYSSCLNLYKNVNKNVEMNEIVKKWLNIAYDCCVLNEFTHRNDRTYSYFYVGDIYKKYS